MLGQKGSTNPRCNIIQGSEVKKLIWGKLGYCLNLGFWRSFEQWLYLRRQIGNLGKVAKMVIDIDSLAFEL